MGAVKNKCLLVCAMPIDLSKEELREKLTGELEEYFVIGADSGYLNCQRLGITPDVILGDFDTAPRPTFTTATTEVYPVQKNDTDSMLGIKKAIALDHKEIVMLGALGGRLDHTYGNIQSLVYMMNHGCSGKIIEKNHTIQLVYPEKSVEVKQFHGYLSVFAYTPVVEGVTLEGVFYPLENAQLSASFPLGVSNQITKEKAVISCTQGVLVVMTAIECD